MYMGDELRDLCERATKEADSKKLLELVRQINELLTKTDPRKGVVPFVVQKQD